VLFAALRRLGVASALGALALSATACGGPGDGSDNTNESTENVPEAFHGARPWRGVLARESDAGAAPVTETQGTAASSAAASSAAASAGASAASSASGSSSAATAASGATASASAFWFPPIGDLGSCPAMVQEIGFGVCTQDQILKTCTLAAGTVCECIRVDGEGQSAEIVCPAPGL
jgi:hypothetical protein